MVCELVDLAIEQLQPFHPVPHSRSKGACRLNFAFRGNVIKRLGSPKIHEGNARNYIVIGNKMKATFNLLIKGGGSLLIKNSRRSEGIYLYVGIWVKVGALNSRNLRQGPT